MKHILFQIWRWMMQPKVWRFLGFSAAVVGLLCNALSSSFNYLFGDWNLFKIILYTVFSFIICVLILFAARIWQHSRSRWFQAHTTYVVLAITSLYSYFFDKLMHITPDAYSLISCASFAVTALSLSRNKTQCGFEIGLLYFLLGCLMMQLMKIKLKLFILGAVFSYFLIILRSSLSSIDARENKQYSEFQDGNSVVLDMDSLQLASTNTSSAINSMDSQQLVISSTDIGSMIEKLETCVKELKHQNSKFIQIPLGHAKKYEHSQLVLVNPNFMTNMLNKEPIKDLEEKTNLMVNGGFEKDFSYVYNNCCRESSTASYNIIFLHERRLYNHIFFGFSPASDFPWGSNIQLLNFADYVVTKVRLPEQLFKILEMLEIVCDLILEFESLFYYQFNVSLKKEQPAKWKKLGETIKRIYMELEYVCNTADPTTS
uniref:Exocyst subunit Exo70 family protein n=1 Tax=Medicago truncatula TaxID=3880 RepID=B7FLZ4_MEDTR|nr:unknown [Medicago truncatula]AFK35901.1 unknown [Medicago truncatula]